MMLAEKVTQMRANLILLEFCDRPLCSQGDEYA